MHWTLARKGIKNVKNPYRMEPVLFKEKVQNSLRCKVSFLGKEEIMLQVSDSQFQNITSWLHLVVKENIRPLHPKRNQKYKNHTTNELLVFRYALTIEGSAYRILLVKIKNKYYWEFHLGKHDYYDKLRKKLFLG